MPDAPAPAVHAFSNWANVHTRLLWLYEGPPVQARRAAGANANVAYSAWCLLRGSVAVGSRGEAFARTGEWVLLPPRAESFAFSADAEIVSVHFQAEWHDGRPLFHEAEPVIVAADHPLLGGAHGLSNTSKKLKRAVIRNAGAADYLLRDARCTLPQYLAVMEDALRWTRAWVEVMVAHGAELLQAEEQDPRVATAVRMIDSQSLQSAFPERVIAKRVGLTIGHLDRLFVAAMGSTVRAYAEGRRLDLARRELRLGGRSIKQLAFELGFKQPSYFTAWFHKHAGVTPSAYRKQGPAMSQTLL